MKYHVTLDFKRGPSFGPVDVDTATEGEAKQAAHREAQLNGFTHPVKKATVRPAEVAA
jgi:hypothetical protein